MGSVYGKNIRVSIFGQSHSDSIGVTIDGFPAGFEIDMAKLAAFMERRAPGRNAHSTKRREPDKVKFLSGLVDNVTCGAPICAVIENTDIRSSDYDKIKDVPRPAHADYTGHVKHGGYGDVRGGGHFSGRLTAPLCIAGAICIQWLESRGVKIAAHIYSIADIDDVPFNLGAGSDDIDFTQISSDFPVIDVSAGEKMKVAIEAARADGDSVGGVIECAVVGLPAGIGNPIFGSAESEISSIIFSVPAVRGIEFGMGFAASKLKGSSHNDDFAIQNGKIITETNNHGGILGGITSGMPIVFRAAIKPTPSISKPQQSISLSRMQPATLEITGRHDPCIVPRAVPVIEAATAVAIVEMGAAGEFF